MDQVKLSPDRVGEEVIIDGRKYRIIGDDSNSRPLRKEWDLWIRDTETGVMRKVMSEEIQQ